MVTGTLLARMRAEFPKEAFKPQPYRVLLAIPLVMFLVAATWAVVNLHFPWYVALPISIVIGNTFGTFAFLAHETCHGTTVKQKWLQDVIGYLAFFPFAVTPTLWRIWHNQVHHCSTNLPDVDPDSYGTLERFKKIPMAKFQFISGVGSGHPLSLLFYFYRFTYHAQTVLWLHSKHYAKEFKGLNRRRAIAESMLILVFWIALAIYLGPRAALFGIVIPMAVGNFVIMSYISTNHFLRPLTEKNDPLENSMSVTSPRWVNWMHLNFSHHVEHHIFPTMNWKYTHLVKKFLLEHAKERYLAPKHWKAFLWLYRTPRVYADAETLINPYTGKTVNIHEVEKKLCG